ncbi:hypothetical protein Syun_018713 [Stephania yunnanensis]|uniref:Uncharacterized protein n=1 Tax=Stephania yunnanensis TaxID=152371 RepID=A0AAP0IV40_9MAGN
MTFIDTRSERFYDRLQRRRLELTQATPDQPVDDEAVYLNVVGECPKGRVYGLGSLGRKKRKYADPGASTSQMPKMVPRAEFDIVADQLRKVPSAWRPVLEDPSNLQIFFYYYAIAFSLISREFNCSEGAVGVNGSHGFRNLAGSVVHLLGLGIVQFGTWAYRGPCFNQLRDITSLDASSYGYSHIGSLREMFLRSFTVDVSGLDKTSIIKHLREITSARIKKVKSALYWVLLNAEAAHKDLRKRGVLIVLTQKSICVIAGAEAMLADLGQFSVRSIQSVTELQDGSALFITVAKYLSPSRHDIDQVGNTTDVQRTTDMLTSTRGLSSKDNKGTSSSLEADSCIMVAELELEMQESKGSAS